MAEENGKCGPPAEDQPAKDEHLQVNRSMILQRSLLCGLAGIVPVPALSDALPLYLRRGLLLRIAEQRHVDVSDAALRILSADSPTQERLDLFAVLTSGLPLVRPRRWTRGLFLGILLLARLEETLRVFQMGTLFDHYCARHHLGPGLTEEAAMKLRMAIDETTRRTQRQTAVLAFEKALSTAGHALLALPGKVVRGIREIRARRDLQLAARAEQEGGRGRAFLKRAVPVVQAQTQALMRHAGLRPYVGRLVRNFDQRWGGGKADNQADGKAHDKDRGHGQG